MPRLSLSFASKEESLSVRHFSVRERMSSLFEVSIVPALFRTKLRRNNRIFQHLSSLDIVLKLLEEWDLAPDLELVAKYPIHEYRIPCAAQAGDVDPRPQPAVRDSSSGHRVMKPQCL
jgi:uncharacterized protein involved in type VI secretion and phage assembly